MAYIYNFYNQQPATKECHNLQPSLQQLYNAPSYVQASGKDYELMLAVTNVSQVLSQRSTEYISLRPELKHSYHLYTTSSHIQATEVNFYTTTLGTTSLRHQLQQLQRHNDTPIERCWNQNHLKLRKTTTPTRGGSLSSESRRSYNEEIAGQILQQLSTPCSRVGTLPMPIHEPIPLKIPTNTC